MLHFLSGDIDLVLAEICKHLAPKEKEALFKSKFENNMNFLHLKLNNPTQKLVNCLINYGVSVHEETDDGKTPLFFCNSLEKLQALLDANCNINHRDKHGNTALHYYAVSTIVCYEIIQKLLMCKGIETNVTVDGKQTTALHILCMHHEESIYLYQPCMALLSINTGYR
jgi:ankyrin repeat protein